jgi:hypothetical protein
MDTVGHTRNEKPRNYAGFRAFLDYFGLAFGTSGRTRTDTLLRARDFESRVSTNFTTLAKWGALYQRVFWRQR